MQTRNDTAMTPVRYRLLTCFLVLGSLLLAPTAQAQKNYILATATTGGVYYPVGVALATLTKVKLQPQYDIGMSAINSAGSGENIRLLRENEAQFAILQGLYGYYAATGTGALKSDGVQENLRSVSMLWYNVEQFLLSSGAVRGGTVEDMVALKGRTMAMGKRNSGTLGSNIALLAAFGIDVERDFELFDGGYTPSAEAVQNGKAIGMGAPGGVPLSAITRLFASVPGKVKILSFTPEQAKRADGGRGLWVPYTIPANTYPSQDEAVETIAQPNFLATTSDIDEETIYLLVKLMYENLPLLNAIHPATKAMSLERAIAGLPLPLHEGAARYYREVGLTIPTTLISE